MKNELIKLVEKASSKEELPEFDVGDTVQVHQRILEGGKERVQVFEGTVIARKGEGIRASFVVRRIVQGEGVERIFPMHSPKIAKVVSKRKGITRRAKLYYLRDRVGKATKLRERKEGDGRADGKAASKSRAEATEGATAAAESE